MIICGPLLFPVMATALGQRPKGSWPFVFNIKHPGGIQRPIANGQQPHSPDGRTSVATCMIRAHSISIKKVKYKQSSRTQRAQELCLYINSFKSLPYACGKQWRYCDGQSR